MDWTLKLGAKINPYLVSAVLNLLSPQKNKKNKTKKKKQNKTNKQKKKKPRNQVKTIPFFPQG
jgi:hypothetical protein